MGATAIVAGATGLIGRELVNELLNHPDYERVYVLVRQSFPLSHNKLTVISINFDALDIPQPLFVDADVFCTLGTTMKKAGSKESFRKVDLDYPLALARLAQSAGARQFLIVTAMGASEQSSIFYNRVKGEVERRLQSAGWPMLHIFRPSLLLGERQEFRFGERAAAVLMKPLGFVWIGPLRKYKPIAGRSVAAAMVRAAEQRAEGAHIYESAEIADMAKERQ